MAFDAPAALEVELGNGHFAAIEQVGQVAVEEIEATGFVLRDAGTLPVGEGPSINLMELIPLSKEEYGLVRSQGSRPWLANNAHMTPQSRSKRWKLRSC